MVVDARQYPDPDLLERATQWAIHKLYEAGARDGDAPDVQRAQAALLDAALAVPTLIDSDDDGSTELVDPDG